MDAIADYIALDKPEAARQFVQRVFRHVKQLSEHPKSGSRPPELKGWRYRQIVESPCRIFYRIDGQCVYFRYVMRGERLFQARHLAARDKKAVK